MACVSGKEREGSSCSSCPREKSGKPQKQQIKIKGEKMRKREKNGEVGITYARIVLQGLLFLVLKLSSPQPAEKGFFFSFSSLSCELIPSLSLGLDTRGAGRELKISLLGWAGPSTHLTSPGSQVSLSHTRCQSAREKNEILTACCTSCLFTVFLSCFGLRGTSPP